MKTKPTKHATPAGRQLGLFVVTMLTFGITTTLHGLSPLATYGLGSLFYLGLAVVAFLIPAGLVAAELATAWEREGGVFLWVSEAFGQDMGFLATWLQWLQNIIFWTVILTSSASMVAIGFGWQAGAHNTLYTAAVVIGTIWFTTLMTIKGLKTTGKLGIIGSLAGTILPGIILMSLAAYYLLRGSTSNLSLDPSTLLPDLSQPGNLSFAISTIMIFAGVELMGTRVSEIRNAPRNFPRATFLAIALTVCLLVPVTLAIAILVPGKELNIAAGLVQAVQAVFAHDHALGWIATFFAVALWLDAMGEIAGWMAGTPIAMAHAGTHGYLPKKLSTREDDVAPIMLVAQAIFGSLISLAFIVIPDVQSAFWLLSALLVQLYVVMYLLLFAAALRLRKKEPGRPRPFRVPCLWLVCGVGLLSSCAVFIVGFFKPVSLTSITETRYLTVLGTSLFIALVFPVVMIVKRRVSAKS